VVASEKVERKEMKVQKMFKKNIQKKKKNRVE